MGAGAKLVMTLPPEQYNLEQVVIGAARDLMHRLRAELATEHAEAALFSAFNALDAYHRARERPPEPVLWPERGV